MAIEKVLIEHGIKPAGENKLDNVCIYSHSKTDFRLPNGDYICTLCYNQLKDMNWLDKNDNYTDALFKNLTYCYPYTDKRGHVHIISHTYLEMAQKENNQEAYLFFKDALPEDPEQENTTNPST